MLTPFGKEVRRLRIDTNTKLKDLAGHLKVSSAFLSSVETGKKEMPTHFVESIIRFFKLRGEPALKLREAADQSRRVIRIDLRNMSASARELASVFARRFDAVDQKTIDKLRGLLNEGEGQ
jgi:transcriptional regulator with XRE-family HTH domain